MTTNQIHKLNFSTGLVLFTNGDYAAPGKGTFNKINSGHGWSRLTSQYNIPSIATLQLLCRLFRATHQLRALVILQPLSHHVGEIDSHLSKKIRVFMHDIHTFFPSAGIALDTAELACEKGIEIVEVMLSPFDTSAAHDGREALLVDTDSVLDKREVDVGDLEDVKRKVAFEDTCPGYVSYQHLLN